MNRVFIVVCCLRCLGAREEGIMFGERTFNEALAKTTREGKMVFVEEMLTQYAEMLKGGNDVRLPEVIRELFTRLTDEERLSEKYWHVYGRVDYFPVGSETWDFLANEVEQKL